jgi:hypothetical protein
MKRNESSIERAVCKWADQRGILHSKLNPLGRRGWPDRAFWITGGKPLLVEFKKRGERPNKLQAYILKRLRSEGYDVNWLDNKKQAIARLRRITGKAE